MKTPSVAALFFATACTAANPDYRPPGDPAEDAGAGDAFKLERFDGAATDDAATLLPDLAGLAAVDLSTLHDMTDPPDLAKPTCGVDGISCCPGNVCNDGSFCAFGWCQTQCGLAGKAVCDGPDGPCAPGLLSMGNQSVINQNGYHCVPTTQYCIPANGCGSIAQPCCDQNGQPLQGMGIGLCHANGGYCRRGMACVTCQTPP